MHTDIHLDQLCNKSIPLFKMWLPCAWSNEAPIKIHRASVDTPGSIENGTISVFLMSYWARRRLCPSACLSCLLCV